MGVKGVSDVGGDQCAFLVGHCFVMQHLVSFLVLQSYHSEERAGLEVIKLFMLNSTEHEIYPAHKCLNANNCWHFNICQRDKYNF